MSVIVKGIEKPPKCEWLDENHDIHRCPLLDGDDNCKLQNCDPYWSWHEQYEGCPLIELPPHGNLIDADRLLTDRMKSKYYHLPNGDIAIPIIDIENAPTVLEAEVEE